jgi:hypothetical protein
LVYPFYASPVLPDLLRERALTFILYTGISDFHEFIREMDIVKIKDIQGI